MYIHFLNSNLIRVRALGLELVRPVVAFLLTEPQTGDIYCDARRGIIRVLLSQMRPETTDLSTGQKLDTDRGDEQSQARPIEVAALLLKLLPQAPVSISNYQKGLTTWRCAWTFCLVFCCFFM